MKRFINKVVNADCFDIIPKISNKTIDLAIIDTTYADHWLYCILIPRMIVWSGLSQ